jgi:hypothetical protein
MEIKVNITRSVDDLKAAFKLHYDKYYPRSKYISVMLVVAGVVIFFSQGTGHNPADTALISFFLVVYGGSMIWSRYNAASSTGKMRPNMLGEESTFISEFKIEFDSKYAHTMLTWDIFTDAIVSDQVVLLYINRLQFIIFPARFFTPVEYTFLQERAALCAAKTHLGKTPLRPR